MQGSATQLSHCVQYGKTVRYSIVMIQPPVWPEDGRCSQIRGLKPGDNVLGSKGRRTDGIDMPPETTISAATQSKHRRAGTMAAQH